MYLKSLRLLVLPWEFTRVYARKSNKLNLGKDYFLLFVLFGNKNVISLPSDRLDRYGALLAKKRQIAEKITSDFL